MADTPCATCSSPAPEGAAFCPACGAPLTGRPVGLTGDQALATLQRALASSHNIIRLLGRGGMGSVYLARERALDRLVAIKVLRPETTDADAVERFRREARTAARLNHPNIVPLHSFGEAEGLMYFVMGFVQGETLAARLNRQARLQPAEARRVLGEVAEALHYAHERGVVHRDVKPDNILLDDETGRPMLGDFGVAKSRASGETLTQLGTALGTPHYMSPEQAAGERDVDGRSDLYSLGVVGYQMVAGRCPFDGESVRDIMAQHVTREPPPLATAPGVPADLEHVITRLLAKDPARRIPDGRSVATALRADSEPGGWIPDDAEDLVSDLRPVPLLVGGALYVAYGAAIFGDWTAAAGTVAVAGLLSLLPIAQRHSKKLTRYSWRSILSWALRKPRWWTSWWPQYLRGPDDLWARLPEAVRQFRVAYLPAISAMILAMPVWLRAGWGDPSVWWITVGLPLSILPGAAAMGVLGWRGFRLHRWGRSAGLTSREISRLMEDGDHGAVWNKPHIEKLLLPKVSRTALEALQAPRTARQQVQALEEALRSLGGPAREMAGDAAAAARDVLRAVEALDVQIAQLARDADPAERADVESKLAALRQQQTGPETEAQRRRRSLLEQQLELSQGLAAQLEAAQRRRDHLRDVLRTLALQIASLEAAHRHAVTDDADLTGRIRAVTEDARRYVEAYREIEAG